MTMFPMTRKQVLSTFFALAAVATVGLSSSLAYADGLSPQQLQQAAADCKRNLPQTAPTKTYCANVQANIAANKRNISADRRIGNAVNINQCLDKIAKRPDLIEKLKADGSNCQSLLTNGA